MVRARSMFETATIADEGFAESITFFSPAVRRFDGRYIG